MDIIFNIHKCTSIYKSGGFNDTPNSVTYTLMLPFDFHHTQSEKREKALLFNSNCLVEIRGQHGCCTVWGDIEPFYM